MGASTVLRISDLLRVQWHDVYDERKATFLTGSEVLLTFYPKELQSLTNILKQKQEKLEALEDSLEQTDRKLTETAVRLKSQQGDPVHLRYKK